MMKINMVIITAAAIALPLQFAQAQEEPSINAQLAATDISGYNTGLALMVGYEHPVPALHKNLSIEGEVTATILNPENTYTILGTSYKEDMSYYMAGVYVKYSHPINQQFSVFGRAGVHYENITYKYENNLGNFSGTETGLGRNIGIGADYHLNPKMDVTLGATLIDSDNTSNIKHISAGMKFKL